MLPARPFSRVLLEMSRRRTQFIGMSHTRRLLPNNRAHATQARRGPIGSLLVVRKQTPDVLPACARITEHIRATYPGVRIFREAADDALGPGDAWSPGPGAPPIDLVLTLGGDGTILHASSLFRAGPVPPVLSFSLGTLGFLLPFHIDDYPAALHSVFEGKYALLERLRLACTFLGPDGKPGPDDDWEVMNELALHRGAVAHLTTVDVFVDGQHLTEAVSDGLILSTPTGSTAYSLSAGGPIVHPAAAALLLTPISPRSLSFRPLVFPATSVVTLQVSPRARAPAGAFLDGQDGPLLAPGAAVRVRASPHPVPCVARSSVPGARAAAAPAPGAELGAEDAAVPGACAADGPGCAVPGADDWVRDINGLLQYNATFRSLGAVRHNR